MGELDGNGLRHMYECEFVSRTTSLEGNCVQWVNWTRLVPVTCMSASMCLELCYLRVTVCNGCIDSSYMFECEYVSRTTSLEGNCVQYVNWTGLVPVMCMSVSMCLELRHSRVTVCNGCIKRDWSQSCA